MKTVILTVAHAGANNNHYRLDLDDKTINREINTLTIVLENEVIEIVNALKTYLDYGNLSHPTIHNWIIDNGLNNTPVGSPAKLIFSLSINENIHNYVIYPFQANLL